MYQIGIDVSKKKLDICLLAKGIEGKQKTKVIKNDHHSAKTLIEWLKNQKCLLEDVRITLESTGTYHEQLCTYILITRVSQSLKKKYKFKNKKKSGCSYFVRLSMH
ncbi:transposase [Arsenophonus sp. ENCA]|uniref:IS110 family transposase n=1 Tax=Arsenophonus sp. ENCA TaxID=1987579 RepID=UPI0025BA03DC|nr:transposase [Arsenophonus sp. ENCA]